MNVSHRGDGPDVAASLVRDQLTDVLASEEFAGSERRRDLLRYLVVETIEGRGDGLKGYRIGRAALGRPSGFDPQTDPIVRVEIGRLRSTLDRYYRNRPESPVVISIPKGRYAAEFLVGAGRGDEAHDSSIGSGLVLQIEPFLAATPRATDLAESITQSVATRVATTTRDPASVFVGHAQTRDAGDVVTERCCRLSGTVRCVGHRVRLTIEGYPPGSDRPVWSSQFDDETTERHEFDVVDRLSERVIWALLDDSGALARSGHRIVDRNAPADVRQARIRYWAAFDTVDPAELLDAARVLEPVASNDQSDARSVAAFSDTLTTSWFLSLELGSETLDRGEELAVRALALDPDLPEAHLALSYVHFARCRPVLMEREIEVALEVAPPSPTVLSSSAIIYALDGSWERSEPLMARAVELNRNLPKYWRLVPCIAALHRDEFDRAYSQALQIGDAIGWAGRALRLASAFPLGLALDADLRQFESLAPDPAVQPFEETVGRAFHDPLVQKLVLGAIAAGPTGSA